MGNAIDWVFMMLVLALVSAVFWFAGLAGSAANFTMALFWLALLIAAIVFTKHLVATRRAP